MTQGIVTYYVLDKQRALPVQRAPVVTELKRLVSTVNEHEPGLPVVIYTDDIEAPVHFPTCRLHSLRGAVIHAHAEHILHAVNDERLSDVQRWKYVCQLKQVAMLASPFDESLYVDTDAQILRPFGHKLWGFNPDVLVTPARPRWAPNLKGRCNHNAGVIAYKRNLNTQLFLTMWLQTTDKICKSGRYVHDNDSMAEVIKSARRHTVDIGLIPTDVWNVRPRFARLMTPEQREQACILHCHGLDANDFRKGEFK